MLNYADFIRWIVPINKDEAVKCGKKYLVGRVDPNALWRLGDKPPYRIVSPDRCHQP